MAARQGILRPETEHILDGFGVAPPVLVTDVRPRVADVMTSPAVTVHQDTSLYEVGNILQQRGIRVVPVIDDDRHLRGVTRVEDFARAFITGLALDQLNQVPLDLDNVTRALGGEVLVTAPESAPPFWWKGIPAQWQQALMCLWPMSILSSYPESSRARSTMCPCWELSTGTSHRKRVDGLARINRGLVINRNRAGWCSRAAAQ